MGKIRAKVVGTGMFVPPKVVTNDDLAQLFDTSDEWIVQRTGIKTRHHIEPGMTASDLALEATNRALDMANMKAEDLDYIMCPSLSPEHYFPGTSAFLHAKLGLKRTPAVDIRAQCTGFIYSLQLAQALIESGIHKRILVCGVEIHSQYIECTNRGRDTAVIFGDGAGAVIFEAGDDGKGLLSTHVHAMGRHARKLWMEYPASHLRYERSIGQDAAVEGKLVPQMEGKFVFKHAVTKMPEVVMEALAHNEMIGDDVDLFLFHQANLRINEFVAKMMDIPEEKRFDNIMQYGNCSAASIPMLLDECVRNGKAKEGTTIAMAGFGSGFTWGGAVLQM
ncbi:MAG: ketoacyl-ACP synthase III [Deltaproteobacteria bacterium]|nr:ketoacyl-ACP synthase III [Deltaproteobacteria bacterium]